MGNNDIKKTTETLVQPILEDMNLELVDIEFQNEGKNWYLRVYVDKDGGVEIEECGQVSEKLSEKLDEEDPINFPYFLEVSSPGAERPLNSKKDMEKHVGHHVHMKLYEHIDGEKELEGKLISFEDEVATIEVKVKAKTKKVEVPYEKIAKARLAVSFN
ncbi:ribosome maturation factor RimP [Pontibacillus yanchengensis]|uniref:Ribosome maturation factor RimP n=2 Tax=Pontibacillus yanchengensis TaxID=462910 RepID=A0ACC7VDE2_9BACI|nr:ribosome maturation factor RimP [Pontibacillus yanchengensis]MYL33181.1 ribosome maturation factor RimP [Pontibacillus yanchengensis]MYL51969.1 ribosome maturation factor RimP [Pontibacillus yanchengensis]